MMTESEYVKIFTGSFIIVQLIQSSLEDIGIEPILKDEFQTGLKAVLVNDYPSIIDVYVHKDELDRALPVVQGIESSMSN